MRIFLLISLAATLLFGSCQKEIFYDVPPIPTNPDPGTGNPGNTTAKSRLVGTWVTTASVSTIEWPAPLGTQTSELFSILPACNKDNQFTFKADFTLVSDEGPTKCNSTDPQVISTGTWEFYDNDKKFKSTTNGITIEADVLELTATTFKIRYVTDFTGIKATTTTTYTKL